MSCNCNNCNAKCDQITIPNGQDGEDAYVYIAYADDSNGNGFDTSDQTKDYISIVSTNQQKTNDKSLHSGNWHQWASGAAGTNGGILYNNNSSKSTTNTSLTQLMSATVSGGTIAKDDDVVRIKAVLEKDTTDPQEVSAELRIWWSSNVSSFYTSKVSVFRMSDYDSTGVIDVYLTRVANDAATADTSFERSSRDLYEVVGAQRFFDDTTEFANSVDWDNDDLEVEVYASVSDGSGLAVRNEHLSVERVEKV